MYFKTNVQEKPGQNRLSGLILFMIHICFMEKRLIEM